MEPVDHIRAPEPDGHALAAAADRARLHARVPSCPGWKVRELLRHFGYVHRWAATLAFWARWQADETAIHRADAELASGQVIAFAPEFAADGVDELVIGFSTTLEQIGTLFARGRQRQVHPSDPHGLRALPALPAIRRPRIIRQAA